MNSQRTLTVTELAEVLRTALGMTAPYGVWVEGEISGFVRSRHGHTYFDLVEPGDIPGAPPKAKARVALLRWARAGVDAAVRGHGDAVRMADGVRVRIHGRLDYYAPAGRLQLLMTGIDPAYTLGRIASDRDMALMKLDDEGVLGRNAALTLPDVPLRVGLVTASRSAARADVVRTLADSGFAFTVLEADAQVQGTAAPSSIAAAIESLAPHRTGTSPTAATEPPAVRGTDHGADILILARGGGSRTDLAAFDHESVARAVAMCPLPVFTGIGHDIDRSAADAAAHTAHATPTAAAEAVVGMVEDWLNGLDVKARSVAARSRLALTDADRRLQRHADRLSTATRSAVREAERRIDSASARIRALDPAALLRRGWSITRRLSDGAVVRSADDVATDDVIVTQTADGILTSTVTAGATRDDPRTRCTNSTL